MAAYIAVVRGEKVDRVVLVERAEGAYVFVFRKPDSKYPEEDHLQDDLDMAMRACEQDYGISREMWSETGDPGLI